MQQFNCVQSTCSRPYSTSTVAIVMTTAKLWRKFFRVTSLRELHAQSDARGTQIFHVRPPPNTPSRARPPTWLSGGAGDKGGAQIRPRKRRGRPSADPSLEATWPRQHRCPRDGRCDVFPHFQTGEWTSFFVPINTPDTHTRVG